MKMKWGALVVDGRNKIGGHVASKNRNGSYLRTKVTPVNRQSTAQTTVRNRLSTISKAWHTITQAQRDAWGSAVSAYKKTDIFGDIQNPSGFSLYQKVNNNIMTLGGTIVTNPPIVAALDGISGVVLTYTVGTPALSLASTVVSGTDHGFKIFATAPQSAGKSFVKSEYKLILVGTSALPATENILSAYTAVFGTVGVVGQKIFVQVVACGAVSGSEGIPIAAHAISVA
jgi:hypothetical protein